MAQLYANNAYGSLASSASAVTTTLTLTAGNGARFPNPTGGDFFLATLIGLDGNGNESSWEIVKCTARATDTLTVVRAQESTTAAIWAGGTRIELRATAGGFGTYLVGNQTVTLSGDATGSGTTAITVTLGTVAVSKGGTGATTLTGIAKGNGTSAFTAAVAGTDYVSPAGLTAFTGSSNIATVGTITNALYRHKPETNVNLFAEDGGGFYSDYTVQDDGTTYIARKIGGSTVTLQSGASDILAVSSTGLELVGTARRITGDMSNATLASRVSFQTSTTNGTTAVQAIANGTAAASYYVAFAGSDPANAAYGWLSATTSGMDIYSDKTGTGSVQPIRFLTGGTVRASVGALGGVDLSTGLREARVAMGANDIDLRIGNYFTKTISTTTTLTVSNVPATGTAASFILDLTNGGSATITWWANTKWAGGTAPTLTAAGRDCLGFFTHNGGTTWTGLVLAKDVK